MEFTANVRDLIELHQREGVVHRPVDVTQFYEKDPGQSVSFDIVFTAFIATITLSTPRTGTVLDWFMPWVGGALLLLTLVRRITLDNIFVDREAIFQSTLSFVIYLASFSFLYLSLSLGDIIGELLAVGPYLVTGVLLIIFLMGIILLYEVVFLDFMLWGAIMFYNEAVDESKDYPEALRNELVRMARWVLEHSFRDYNRDHFIVKRIFDYAIEDEGRSGKIAMVILATVVVLTIFMIVGIFSIPLAWIQDISLVVAAILNISLFFSFLAAVGLIEFFYVRYGTADSKDVTAKIDTLRVIILMYIAILLHAGIIEQALDSVTFHLGLLG